MSAGTELLAFAAVVVGDIMGAADLPFGGTLSDLVRRKIAERRQRNAEILIEELKAGKHGKVDFQQHDLDPLVGVIIQFAAAADQGAAHENLRLLAQIIAGLKKNKALEEDAFRRWCNVLKDLTRDELMLVGKAYRIAKDHGFQKILDRDAFSRQLREEMEAGGYKDDEITSLCTRVSRTGLIVPASGWGTLTYSFSNSLLQLGELASIADIG